MKQTKLKCNSVVLCITATLVAGCTSPWVWHRDGLTSDWTLVKANEVQEEKPKPAASAPKPLITKMTLPQRPQEPTQEQMPQALLVAIQEANSQATQTSSQDSFVLSTQYFDYVPGQIYQVVASPGFVTTLALEPGEQPTSIASGDSHRWEVQTTASTPGHPGTSGSSNASQALVLIKPLRPWLTTNMLLVTDRRVYSLDLMSVPGGVYNATVAWRYPGQMVTTLIGPDQNATLNTMGLAPIQPDRLDFGYTLTVSDRRRPPKWLPLQVYNDGAKTVIQFPQGVQQLPPLFARGKEGTQVINYRVKDHFYIVDKVIDRAELRLGKATVRIDRQGSKHKNTKRSRGRIGPSHRN